MAEERKPSMPFGKHKGTAIEELPDSYLWWLAFKCELSADWLAEAVANEAVKRGLDAENQPKD